ncbi:MAG: infB [Geobacteraceae bacterium]|nr:infB [Geobacteraceae bacterium]
MNRTRVYELAQKLGVDNKEIIARLKSIGVEVKNHMAALDEDIVQKLSEPPAAIEVSQEEVRVKPTLIRRRPKIVEEPIAAKPEVAPEEEAAKSDERIHERAGKVPADEDEKKVAKEHAPEEIVAEKKEKIGAKTITEAPAVTPKDTEAGKATMTRARILGRVEIQQPSHAAKPAERQPLKPVQQKEYAKPAPAPTVETAAAAEERKKLKKGKEVSIEEVDRTPKKGGFVAKKKEGLKKHEILEKRERVFEPQPRSSKGRKKEKEREPASRKTEITTPKAIKRIIKITESITVGELAKRMGTKANDLIRSLMKMGLLATINHPLDYDTACIIAADFGYEIENVAIDLDEMLEAVPDTPESLVKRPPVVTIMGHVDHGKTSLLDAIRETNVIAGEAGGITQHIGAYDVELKGRKITFLDTPGHAAFTAMRARGAKVTDIVILVVAADDGVMPQTREAINHSKAAGVPIIIAINKIDKPEAKPEKIKQELMEFGLVSEEWGGETIFVEVSAKKRINLEALLEMVLLQADVMELKANPAKEARGTIIEAKLDRGRGPVATVLVQDGTLNVGDYFVSGVHFGRVRAMQNERGVKIPVATPSMPAEVIGFAGVPDAGDSFVVLADEKQAKEIASYRQQKIRETELAKTSKLSLEQLYEKIQKGEVKELNVIIKGDVQGSVEAVSESLRKLTTDAIRLVVIHASVGAITETDVNLAAASNAIVLGFNVRPEVKAQSLAEKEGVDIRLYNIIYDAVDDIKKAMEGLLEPTLREKQLGHAEIREVFSVPKHGNVAGCYVLDGKMVRNMPVRLLRDNVVIYEGKMASLRRFKDDIKEVASGYECGISLENYNDIKIGDIIEAYEIEKVAATL